MDNTTLDTTKDPQVAYAELQTDVADLEIMKQQLALMLEVAKVQELAEKIESSGNPEMIARLQPFKDHYDGDVITLIKKRTKQNYENDILQAVAEAGEEAKAKYRSDPDSYFTQEQRTDYWTHAYDKTMEEARALVQNLEEVATTMPQGSAAEKAVTKQKRFKHSSVS